MSIAMTSDVLTQGQIYDAADAVISQRLSQLPGVGGVSVNGSALPAVRVEINPLSLSKYGIGLQDVRAAISNSNANAPKGAIETDELHYQIYTNDNARDAGPYRDLIIANRNGAPVRLRDVATVLDMQDGATENVRTYGLYNGSPAVFVTIYLQPGANIVETIDAVKAELPVLKNSIDSKIDLVVNFDRSVTIRASLRQVEQTLLLSVAFVILVVYIFLNSYRAALIPATVVPVSLIGTFGAMYLLNYTLDNFSLMALTIATGFVVDDAIVVMENTTRHIEAGMTRMRAALLGAREVGFTVLSMSLSLVAVFTPFILIGGILGRLLMEFADDPVGGDPDLAGHFAHHDADDVFAAVAVGTQSRAVAIRARLRTRLRTHARQLRTDARLGAAPPALDAIHLLCDHRAQCLPVHRDSQGIFSAAGYRSIAGRHPRRCGELLSADEGQTAGGRRHHPGRPGGRHRHRLGWLRRIRSLQRPKRQCHRCAQTARRYGAFRRIT